MIYTRLPPTEKENSQTDPIMKRIINLSLREKTKYLKRAVLHGYMNHM